MTDRSPEPIFSQQAQKDLKGIENDVSTRRGDDAVRKILSAILEKARLHAQFRGIGRPRDDLYPGLRSFVVEPYLVFFLPSGDTIELVCVVHHKRDIDRIVRESLGSKGEEAE